MSDEFLLKAAFGFLPVLTFLGVLVHFDSFRLVRVQTVLLALGAGALGAFCAYYIEKYLLNQAGVDMYDLMHFAAPVVEELLTALIIILFIQTNRIGFAFDAVILGFAAGAGFALIENYFFLAAPKDRDLAVWVIRGFGSAIMHGASTAIFALTGHLLAQRATTPNALHYLPGLAGAVGVHTGFNFFLLDFPVLATIGMIIILPLTTAALLNRDKKTIHDWIEVDFDAHKKLLQQIRSGEYRDLTAARFLGKLHDRFGPTVVDKMVYYIELHTELILAAEEILRANEAGGHASVDQTTKEKLVLMREVEHEIGKTGMLALQPHLHFNRHEFWEIYMLEKEAGFTHARPH